MYIMFDSSTFYSQPCCEFYRYTFIRQDYDETCLCEKYVTLIIQMSPTDFYTSRFYFYRMWQLIGASCEHKPYHTKHFFGSVKNFSET